MARTGRFGRRRAGSTTNLTMLIASLMREQRQAEDRAAFDAWQNGGEFKGKPMTDDRIIEYIKGRRDGFSTDDPLWDQWNNQLIQAKFQIGEQKITTAFKEGKASAGAVAKWYRSQLQNIPKDSAFYRTVAGRAADWAKSAAGAAHAAGRARATASVQSKIDAKVTRINENNALIDQVTKLAIRAGILNPNQNLTTGDASKVEEWLASGVVRVGGQPVSFNDIRRASVDTYRALGEMVPLYKSRGWSTSQLIENRSDALRGVAAINAIDDRSKYEAARDLWMEELSGAGNDPYAIRRANERYAKTLGLIYSGAAAGTGTSENDAGFLSALNGEIAALNGDASGVTVATLYGQAEKDDAATTAQSVAQNAQSLQFLQTGQAFYGQTAPGGQYEVVLDPDGSVRNSQSGLQPSVIRINGAARVVYLQGREIKAGALRAPDGQTIGLSALTAPISEYYRQGWSVVDTPEIIGYSYVTPAGQQSWGVVQSDGSIRFTDQNPFNAGLQVGANDSLVALGEVGDLAAGDPITGYLNPNVNVAGLSPLPPMSMTGVSPADVASVMGLSNDPNERWKAQEYVDYVRETRDATYGQSRNPSPLGNGQMSDSQMERNGAPPIASYVANSLYAIQSALGPLFTAPEKSGPFFTGPNLSPTAPPPPSSYMSPQPIPAPAPSASSAPKPATGSQPPKPAPYVTPPTASSTYKPPKPEEQTTYKQSSGWYAS